MAGIGGFKSPLFRPGFAPLLRAFVPSPEGAWLSDDSVLACEREMKRAGVAQYMRPGDVVWDCALSSEGNVGRLVWDGSYLLVSRAFVPRMWCLGRLRLALLICAARPPA